MNVDIPVKNIMKYTKTQPLRSENPVFEKKESNELKI